MLAETDSDVMTRHEIYKRLDDCRVIFLTKGVGAVVLSQAMEYSDFLLDSLNTLNELWGE